MHNGLLGPLVLCNKGYKMARYIYNINLFDEINLFEDINDCISNLCQHQSKCIDHRNGYTCSCTAGYTGEYCEMSKYIIFVKLYTEPQKKKSQ